MTAHDPPRRARAERTLTLALAGDTMLGRQVALRLRDDPRAPLVAPDVVEVAATADLFVVNLECCISERGERFADPRKPFFFRAPPVAAERLAELGVDAVSLANNHALDYGPHALLDTVEHLRGAGIAAVGAGPDVDAARAPVALDAASGRLRVVAVSDHPAAYAATSERPGIAFADLWSGVVPGWLLESARPRPADDAVLVMAHWGPNMRTEPLAHVRAAARRLVDAGASLVAGHSAHVFQGVGDRVLYDLGDFLDDYATDPQLRNDLGLLWLVTLAIDGPRRIEAVPLRLDFCFTRRAAGTDAAWIRDRLRERCAAFGTEVDAHDGRLSIAVAPR